MLLPPALRKSLAQAITDAFNEPDFENLVLYSSIGFKYREIVPANTAYPNGATTVVEAAQQNGKIGNLIDAVYNEKKGNDLVKAFYGQYIDIFSVKDNDVKIRERAFQRQLLNNDSMLFIGRETFTKGLTQMINKDELCVMGLNGLSRTGISHVSYYLGDIQSDLGCFKFLNLNLSMIGRDYPDEPITAGHLAKLIADELEIADFAGIKDFKHHSFASQLKKKLDALAEKGQKWLFFIDQFDRLHNPSVKALLMELAELVFTYPNIFYLVFSTYDKWMLDWKNEQSEAIILIDFESFTKAEVDQYLDKLYNTLVNRKKITPEKILKDTFIKSAHYKLPDSIYDTSNGPNVSSISKELRIWFRNLKKDLNAQ